MPIFSERWKFSSELDGNNLQQNTPYAIVSFNYNPTIYCSWFINRVLKQDHNHSKKEIYLLISMRKSLHQTIHESTTIVSYLDKYH